MNGKPGCKAVGNESDAELFDDLVCEKLGRYVYALFDPATGQPFYVGKGGGSAGLGNRRIFDHFSEARTSSGKDTEKISKIRQIWKDHGAVPWKIIRSGLRSDEEALLVESALIDMLREIKVALTNRQHGHGAAAHGMMSRLELRAWSAPKLDLGGLPSSLFGRPIFMFNISSGVAGRRSTFANDDPQLYIEATCEYWRVAQKWRSYNDAIAIGCINGIVRAAVAIKHWEEVLEGRWKIIPNEAQDGLQDISALNFKNVSAIIDYCKGTWQRGSFLVFRIDDHSKLTILRGVGVGRDPCIWFHRHEQFEDLASRPAASSSEQSPE